MKAPADVPPGLSDPARVAALVGATRAAREPLMLAEWARARAREGAVFVVGHSGGKDSMLQLERLMLDFGLGRDRVVVAHADLHEMEWPGTADLAREHAEHFGVPFLLVEPYDDEGRRWDWFRKVESREATLRASAARLRAEGRREEAARAEAASPFPSSGQRYCTSDLKRGPIFRAMANYAAARGFRSAVNVLGLRADESDNREKMAPVCHEGESSGVTLYTWLPIQHVVTDAPTAPDPGGVFGGLLANRAADPTAPPWHWAYDLGSKRLSCMFCIYIGNPADLRLAALHAPALYGRHVEAEARTGHSAAMARKFLADMVGMSPAEAAARRVRLPLLRSEPGAERPDDPASTAAAVARVLGEGAEGSATVVVRPRRARHEARFAVRGGELLVAFGAGGAFGGVSGRWLPWAEAEAFAAARLGGRAAVAEALPAPRPRERFGLTPRAGLWAVHDRAAGADLPGAPRGRVDAEDLARRLNAAVAG